MNDKIISIDTLRYYNDKISNYVDEKVSDTFGNLELDELNAILVDTDAEADDPIVPDYVTETELNTALSNKMDKVTLAKVATSGSYNDLSNKPTIPSVVTESTVSGWGFTKNTGTYSKPSGGIPKSDLANTVQTSLSKADTALQSYTEQYKGTVTGVKINGTTKNPSNGVVDLGTVITSHQTLKTINGESIVGSGDITISGGSSSGSEEVYLTPFTVEQFCTGYVELTDEQRNELLNVASQNRIIGMPYNGTQTGYMVADYKYQYDLSLDFWSLSLGVIYNGAHYTNSISSSGSIDFTPSRITITPFKPIMYIVTAEDGVAHVSDDLGFTDNCVFWVDGECSEVFVHLEPSDIGKTVRFFTGESCTLEISYPVYWANGEIPTIEPYTNYELSLVANMDYAFNAVLTPFKPVE